MSNHISHFFGSSSHTSNACAIARGTWLWSFLHSLGHLGLSFCFVSCSHSHVHVLTHTHLLLAHHAHASVASSHTLKSRLFWLHSHSFMHHNRLWFHWAHLLFHAHSTHTHASQSIRSSATYSHPFRSSLFWLHSQLFRHYFRFGFDCFVFGAHSGLRAVFGWHNSGSASTFHSCTHIHPRVLIWGHWFV